MAADALTRYGWSAEWAEALQKVAPEPARNALEPGRVVRHHGVSVDVATARGIETLSLRRGLTTPPVVGDWVTLTDGGLVGVLPRTSLLARSAARRGGTSHPLVANVDSVLITCGLDRPLNAGRIQRAATIAWEAGARPDLVLTKADEGADEGDADTVAAGLAREHPGLRVTATSAVTGAGIAGLAEQIAGGTAALLGESGSGKSSLVNALAGSPVAATRTVRHRDRKGRHTTTVRELHVLPGGGIVVDTPGLRTIGLRAGSDAVDSTFDDVVELSGSCRFRDCAHDREPGCAVRAAVEDGRLDPRRLDAFRELDDEATEAGRPPGRRRRG